MRSGMSIGNCRFMRIKPKKPTALRHLSRPSMTVVWQQRAPHRHRYHGEQTTPIAYRARRLRPLLNTLRLANLPQCTLPRDCRRATVEEAARDLQRRLMAESHLLVWPYSMKRHLFHREHRVFVPEKRQFLNELPIMCKILLDLQRVRQSYEKNGTCFAQ